MSLMPRSTGSVVISVRSRCHKACDILPLQCERLHPDALRKRQTWHRNPCLHASQLVFRDATVQVTTCTVCGELQGVLRHPDSLMLFRLPPRGLDPSAC